MKIIKQIYFKVSNKYNKTKLATEKGFIHKPTFSELEEFNILFKYIEPKDVILDIGTGLGIASLTAKETGAKVITLDNVKLSGSDGLENIKKEGIEIVDADIMNDKLPFEDSSIDLIIFRDVIEHLLHSPKFTLEEFNRILKPGGICFATTPNAVRLSVRLKVLIGISNWSNINLFWDTKYNGHHHHEYTSKEFKQVFEKTNFKIIDFFMKENRINNFIFNSLSDLQTKPKTNNAKDNLFTIVIQKLALILVNIYPQLRSSMILVSKKI